MIKKLRRKLIAITMVLLTVVLMVILAFVFYATRVGLEENSINRLQSASAEMGLHGPPGKGDPLPVRTCFVLRLSPDGKLSAIGSNYYYDLEDPDELMQTLEEAEAQGTQIGVLKDRKLRFLQLEAGRGMAYAFTDISAELETMARLNFTCAMILLVGMLVFFLTGIMIARWAVRPVEQAWDQQRQFVADASHELKTPLTVILTNAELLESNEYDEESKKKFTGSILTMSRQMRGLVEELLDQARVDSGKADAAYKKLDYSKLVSDALLPFEPVYFEAGRMLDSSIQPGLTATGREDHLRQVVEILLDNGCKYATGSDPVTLRLERQGRCSLLSVRSSGVTMTQQQCKDIFKRFYRMDSARAMNRSYGLGLSIAQGIVEQHKGKIWVESVDGWNTFFVSLPL